MASDYSLIPIYLQVRNIVKLGWNILISFSFGLVSSIIMHTVFIFKHDVYNYVYVKYFKTRHILGWFSLIFKQFLSSSMNQSLFCKKKKMLFTIESVFILQKKERKKMLFTIESVFILQKKRKKCSLQFPIFLNFYNSLQ